MQTALPIIDAASRSFLSEALWVLLSAPDPLLSSAVAALESPPLSLRDFRRLGGM